MSHTCSMGDRSGERGDQGGTSTPASSRHCIDIRAICDLALSCWKRVPSWPYIKGIVYRLQNFLDASLCSHGALDEYQRRSTSATHSVPNHNVFIASYVAHHRKLQIAPFNTSSSNPLPNVMMSQTKAGFIRKDNSVRFDVPVFSYPAPI
jgi:hypothetical protein